MRLNDLIDRELGRYRVEALIGRGGMAAVYRAFDTRLQRRVALKVLYPQYLADDDIVERFRREAVTAAQLDHPHIAPIYDVGDADGLFFLAMKLLPGPSLAEVLQREGRLAPERVVTLAHEVASALDAAHRSGIVHRDIKPGNVLFDDRGRAILTDFGIAKSLDAPALTESSVIIGTPDYIAPEQIDPRLATNGSIDCRADLYSFGALLYRALTGHRPFDGPAQAVLMAHLQAEPLPPSSRVPTLPPAVDAVFARAMRKRPDERFPSAPALAAALESSFGETTEVGVVFPPAAIRKDPHGQPTTEVGLQQPTAEAKSAPAETVPQRRRSRLAPLVLAVTVVLLGMLGYALASFARQQDRPTAVAQAITSDAAIVETATGTATPEATSTATRTPSPTAEPISTATVAPTSTAEPTVVVPADSNQPVAGGVADRPPPALPRPSATPRPTTTATPRPRPSATPRPTATQPPAPSATATAAPPTRTPAPTATEVPRCGIGVVGGFGHLWTNNAAVREQLGCPTEVELAGTSVEQIFDTGRMYYREQGNRFWVFSGITSGTYRNDLVIYESDPDPTDAPPPDHYPLSGGFGKIWLKYPTVRDALGWPISPETKVTGSIQTFEYGTMLFVPGANDHGKQIYVLGNNGRFQIYADNYVGP